MWWLNWCNLSVTVEEFQCDCVGCFFLCPKIVWLWILLYRSVISEQQYPLFFFPPWFSFELLPYPSHVGRERFQTHSFQSHFSHGGFFLYIFFYKFSRRLNNITPLLPRHQVKKSIHPFLDSHVSHRRLTKKIIIKAWQCLFQVTSTLILQTYTIDNKNKN